MAVALVLLLVAGLRVLAHETERTRVTLTLARDGHFVLDIANDPAWMLMRIEPFAGGSVPSSITPETRDARLAQLGSVFADRLVLFVDGHEVRAEAVDYLPPSASSSVPSGAAGTAERGDQGGLATYRLTGRMPPGASTLRWFYGIVGDPYPLQVVQADGASTVEWIHGANWSGTIDLRRPVVPPTRWRIMRQYLALGYTHIIPKGSDHILFVLGIFLLSPRVRPLLTQVTVFTVAHSITLGLSIYGMVSLPPRVVEPLIALSIAYVAIENLVTWELKPWRLALVFSFGLLHGLGFAGVLRELGLPREQFLTGLVTFNLGVEGGQLTAIALAMIAVSPWVHRRWYRHRVVIPASLVIAAIGLYWTVVRLMAVR